MKILHILFSNHTCTKKNSDTSSTKFQTLATKISSVYYKLSYVLKCFEFLSKQKKKLEQLLVVSISGFVELAPTFSFNKQRPSYTEKRWIHNSSGKPNYSNFDSTYLVFMIYLTQLSKRSTHLQLHKYLLLHLFNRSRI